MKLSEVSGKEDPLLKKTAQRVVMLLYALNAVYRKNAELDFDLFRKMNTEFTSDNTAAIVVFINSNATDSQEEAAAELIQDALDEEGLIDGPLPIDVTVGKSAFESNAVTIQLSRQK